jgi:hypothetical protein
MTRHFFQSLVDCCWEFESTVSTFDLLWISSIRVRLLQDTTDDPVTLIPELIEPTSRRSDTNPNGSLIRPLVPLFSELDAG